MPSRRYPTIWTTGISRRECTTPSFYSGSQLALHPEALSRRLRVLRPSLADQRTGARAPVPVRVPAAEKCASEWQSTATRRPSPEGCGLRGTDNATSCEGSSTKLSELPDCATAQTRSYFDLRCC